MARKRWHENYALYLLVLFCNRTTVSSPAVVFITEPQDVTANKGDNVTFLCSLNNLDRTTISWNVRPDHNKHETTEEIDHYLTSTLTVQDIDQYDRYITCSVSYASDSSGQFQWRNFSSRRAKLSVKYFPRQSELSCSPQDAISLQEGQFLHVYCVVLRCKPAVDLTWRLEAEDEFDLPLPKIQDNGLMRNLSDKVRVSRELHNKRIICVVTSELAFPGRSLECPTGLIKVLSPPIVAVRPRNAILEDHMVFEFTCMADGYPTVFNFTWSCSSNVKLNGCNGTTTSTNTSVVHISTFSGSTDTEYAIITCTVMNTVGSNSFSSNVMIKQKNVATYSDRKATTPNSCSGGTIKPFSISLQLHEQIRGPIEQMTFWCNVTGNIPDDIQWMWYYNGLLITENEDFIVTNVSMSSCALHFINISKAQGVKEVLCEVTACGHTISSSTNLSVYPEQLSSKFSVLESYQIPLTGTPALANFSVYPEQLSSKFSVLESYQIPSTGTPALPTVLQPGKLATWKIVAMAIAGVLLTIVLTACVVAVVSILLYRHLSNSNTGISKQGPQGPTCEGSPSGGAVYEVPNVAEASFANVSPISTESDGTSTCSLQGTYASEIIRDSFSSTPPQSSSWTSSSDIYMGASPPRKRDGQLPGHTTHTLKTPMYVNQDIVKMHELKK